MKTKWINFYIRIAISFLIYYLSNLYINYSYFLNISFVLIYFVFVVALSVFFIIKKYCVHLCGIISSLIILLPIFGELIQIFFLATKNIGESGFGIIEILSLIPMLFMNISYLIFNCYQYKIKDIHN